MAIYSLIPTQKIIKLARNKNQKPREFLENLTYKIPANAGFDKRRKDKYGAEYIEDLLITREDNSRFIVHELDSPIPNMSSIQIIEIDNENQIISKDIVYLDKLDFSRLQGDSKYLDCFADSLLSQDRIALKKNISSKYGLNEIYVGYVGVNSKTGEYQKFVRRPDDEMLNIIKQTKLNTTEMSQEEMNEQYYKKEKEKKDKEYMLSAILSKLNDFSNEELKEICEDLDISLDSLEKPSEQERIDF